jgi:hypothetical protein
MIYKETKLFGNKPLACMVGALRTYIIRPTTTRDLSGSNPFPHTASAKGDKSLGFIRLPRKRKHDLLHGLQKGVTEIVSLSLKVKGVEF